MKPEDKERFLTHLASLHAHLQKELKLKEKPKVFLASDQKNAVKVLGLNISARQTRTVNQTETRISSEEREESVECADGTARLASA